MERRIQGSSTFAPPLGSADPSAVVLDSRGALGGANLPTTVSLKLRTSMTTVSGSVIAWWKSAGDRCTPEVKVVCVSILVVVVVVVVYV